MRKFLSFLTAFAAVVGLATVATAQVQFMPQDSVVISNNYVAADLSPALYIKYVGTNVPASGATTVQVASGAAITFVRNGAADTSFECPVSGALGGIIDTSNAACDTLGEVVDAINSSNDQSWVAVIANGLRSDASTSLLTAAANPAVTNPEGYAVYWDTSSLDDENIGLFDYSKGILNWVEPGARRVGSKSSFVNSDTVLLLNNYKFTNAGAVEASGSFVYCVVEDYANKSETVETLFVTTAAATTVAGNFNDLLSVGGFHCQGGKLFTRVGWGGADTSVWYNTIYGYRAPLRFGRVQ